VDKFNWLNGRIYPFAGNGTAGYSGDGCTAINAKINGPAGLAIDNVNNVYVVEIFNNVVRKIDTDTNIITTVAGSGVKGFDGDGGIATDAKLNGPEGVFVDDNLNIFIAETFNQRIRRVEAITGIIDTIAGSGEIGFSGDEGDACMAKLNRPSGVVADSKGNVYFNDYANDRIRKVDTNGIISTFVGKGQHGYAGDGGPAKEAMINDVYGLAIDKQDNLYFIYSLNFAVRKVDAVTGIIHTVVGKGKSGEIVEFEETNKSYLCGQAHPKGSVGEKVPHAVEIDIEGNVFIGETAVNRIRIVDMAKNQVYTIVGTGESGFSDNNGFALKTQIGVHGLRVDVLGNLYFIDFHHNVVRVVKFDSY
jgi:trimeric autotransporter adhesin